MTEEKTDIDNQVNDTEVMETDQKDPTPEDTKMEEEEEEDEAPKKEKSPSPEPKEDKANSSSAGPSPSKKSKKEAPEPKSKIDEEEEEEEEDDESSEEEQKVGLFDQPLEVSGSRERKKVQRLDVSYSSTSEKAPEIPEGKGEKLGDCPRIEHQIQKTHGDELKPLHKLLYKRLGSGMEIKKNIRKFSGFPFEKDSSEYQKKKAILEKMTMTVLKHMCELLDIERSGVKEDICTRLMDFLLKPTPSGKSVPGGKKRQSKGGKRGPKSKKSVNSAAEGSEEEDDKDTADQKNGSNESESEAEEKEEKSEEEEEEEEEEEPKKKKRGPRKKAEKKVAPTKRKSTTQRRPRNSKKAKLEESEEEKEEEEEEEEETYVEEPIRKCDLMPTYKFKKIRKPPTDDEIVNLVKSILEGANLEEITMKKVIKEVFEKFPDHDLDQKKEFIKTTVRSLIS